MADAVDLITLAEGRAYLDIRDAARTEDDTTIAAMITAASLELTRMTNGRVFKAASATEATYYGDQDIMPELHWRDYTYTSVLRLRDETCDVTKVVNGDTGATTITASVLKLPLGASVAKWLWINPDSGYCWEYDWSHYVKVTAYWAAMKTPTEDVKLQAKRLLGTYYRLRDSGPMRTVTLPGGESIVLPVDIPQDVLGWCQANQRLV